MIVGEDVAIAAENKPRAAGGRLHRLAENIHPRLGGGIDGNHAVYSGGIENHRGDRGALSGGSADSSQSAPDCARARSAAQQAEGQSRGRLQRAALV